MKIICIYTILVCIILKDQQTILTINCRTKKINFYFLTLSVIFSQVELSTLWKINIYDWIPYSFVWFTVRNTVSLGKRNHSKTFIPKKKINQKSIKSIFKFFNFWKKNKKNRHCSACRFSIKLFFVHNKWYITETNYVITKTIKVFKYWNQKKKKRENAIINNFMKTKRTFLATE